MDPRHYGQRSPVGINTSDTAPMSQGHGRRFSYAETPVDMQQGQEFPRVQRYAHTQEPLREAETPVEGGVAEGNQFQTRSPAANSYQERVPQAAHPAWSSKDDVPVQMRASESEGAYQDHRQAAVQSTNTLPSRPQRMSSPYGVPEPTAVHPAYYAPVVSQTPASQPPQYGAPPQIRRQSTIAMQAEDSRQPPTPVSPTKQYSIQPDHVQIPYSPLRVSTQPIFAPAAATGPNGLDPSLHQPGQLAHPNMNMNSSFSGDKGAFENTLCGCSSDVGTCVTGLFCPCILDSRTSYRLGRRKAKLDPTDMLGFETCNGRCGVMGTFGLCGLCCMFLPSSSPLPTSITKPR